MTQQLQQSFRALADPTRREILQQLCKEELSIGEVVEKFDLSRTAVRKHLTILEDGDLITVTARGKERITRIKAAGIQNTAAWFSHFDQYWDSALGALMQAVENDKQGESGEREK